MKWQEEIQKRFGSNLQCANAMLKHWPKGDPKDEKKNGVPIIKKASLANKIGELRKKGDDGWWAKRPEIQRLLADVLILELDEIFSRGPKIQGTLSFLEFPQLRDLAPHEELCELPGNNNLLQLVRDNLRRPGAKIWLKVPPGGGKTLVINFLQTRHAAEVTAISVQSLNEAESHSGEKNALVVELDAFQQTKGIKNLKAFKNRSASTIIMAPFGFPGHAWFAGSDGSGFSDTGWKTIDLYPTKDWQEVMLKWISHRLSEDSNRDTKMDKNEVLKWLDEQALSVRTPGDLLALCADFDSTYDPESKAWKRAQSWLEKTGPSMLPEDAPSSWKKHVALKTYNKIIDRYMRDTAVRHGYFKEEDWAKLVPDKLLLGGEMPGSQVVIGLLQEAGLLRHGEHGIEPYPTWVCSALTTQALKKEMRRDSCKTWGLIAADESRVHLVDTALDDLSDTELIKMARKLSEQGHARSLAQIAATESLLAALARRINRLTLRKADTESIHNLVLIQLRHLMTKAPAMHHPFTRRDTDEWRVTAWAISLKINAPRVFDTKYAEDKNLAWDFPGWVSALSFTDISSTQLPSSLMNPPRANAVVQQAAELARKIVRRVPACEIASDIPRLFVPGLFLALDKGWKPSLQQLQQLRETWDEVSLAHLAEDLDAKKQTVLANYIWELVDGCVCEKIDYFKKNNIKLADFIYHHVDNKTLVKTVHNQGLHNRDGIKFDASLLLLLTDDGRQKVLGAWLEDTVNRQVSFFESYDLARILNEDNIDMAIELTEASNQAIASEFIIRVWEMDHERARREAERTLLDGNPAAESWFIHAPRSALSDLTDKLIEQKPIPDWVASWAAKKILDSGTAAERLFPYLN